MFEIVGRKGGKFIVLDTEDSVKELYTADFLLSLVKKTGVDIKGVYNNGIVCIYSKVSDRLSRMVQGTPFVLSFKGNECYYLFGEFNVDECRFDLICESGITGFTTFFLRESYLKGDLTIRTDNLDPLKVSKLLRLFKE